MSRSQSTAATGHGSSAVAMHASANNHNVNIGLLRSNKAVVKLPLQTGCSDNVELASAYVPLDVL